MIKKYSSLIFIVCALLCLWHLESCSLINPPETIPCYGHIDKIGLTTNPTLQGSNSANISCAWVYVDDQPVGTFALSNTFPILASNGSHTITIIPGISADGANSTREQYPFFAAYNATVNLTQGSVTHFSYTTSYISGTAFAWLEDFDEGPSFSITTDKTRTISDTSMFRVGAPYSFQGYSGEVVLDSNAQYNHNTYFGYSDTMSLPSDGPDFLELNYNTNATFGVQLLYGDSYNTAVPAYHDFFVTIYPSSGWQKIYIDLSSGVENLNNGPFIIGFYLQRPVGLAQATLLLDNIKVLHLKI
jgi:hypothetical protein